MRVIERTLLDLSVLALIALGLVIFANVVARALFGTSPYRYLTLRRLDQVRRLLLGAISPSEAALWRSRNTVSCWVMTLK